MDAVMALLAFIGLCAVIGWLWDTFATPKMREDAAAYRRELER